MKNELRVWLSILLMISALLVLTTMMDGDIFRSIGYFSWHSLSVLLFHFRCCSAH